MIKIGKVLNWSGSCVRCDFPSENLMVHIRFLWSTRYTRGLKFYWIKFLYIHVWSNLNLVQVEIMVLMKFWIWILFTFIYFTFYFTFFWGEGGKKISGGPKGDRVARFQKIKKSLYRTVVSTHSKNFSILAEVESV